MVGKPLRCCLCRIEELEDAQLGFAQELTNKEIEIEELESNLQKDRHRIALLEKENTQRGARMQIMWEWMSYKDWMYFVQEYPDAKNWFDADGVPAREGRE
jgi:hypothetical protein